jgi:hypothetical protein
MVRKAAPSVKASPPAALIPAAAAMSFLKETRGVLTWTSRDLQKSLLISAGEATQVIVALELQGYIKRAGNSDEWMTTINGEAVSGSKTPRFSREAVEASLSALQERLKSSNKDAKSRYTVIEAVAFGDFLAARAQAQAADVGIQLVARKTVGGDAKSAKERTSKHAFLKTLRARDLKLNLVFYEPWMSERSHRTLLR